MYVKVMVRADTNHCRGNTIYILCMLKSWFVRTRTIAEVG